MEQSTIRRTYVAIATATGAAVAADQLARHAPVISGYALGFTPTGERWEEAIWRADPALATTRDVAWLVAVCLAVWLATHAVEQATNRRGRPRWLPIATTAGFIAGVALGVSAWWLERPGTLVNPGDIGMRAITDEVRSALGPVGTLVGPAVGYAGHDAWLLLAPPITYALYGGFLAVAALIARALLAPRPNDR